MTMSTHPGTATGKKVLVAMSGGMESTVTAALLKSQGYSVLGLYLRICDPETPKAERFGGRCCSQGDEARARAACQRLDLPFQALGVEDVFQERVVDDFVHEMLQNRTPIPCYHCNVDVKIEYVLRKAMELGCDFAATGHYAQVTRDMAHGISHLRRGVDAQMDQSYFLFGLDQKRLNRLLMPLGGLSRAMVTKLAHELGLTETTGGNPQEICFIRGGYHDFIESRIAPSLRAKGMIRTVEGQIVGEHEGLHRYTLGQKEGLTMTGKDTAEYIVVGFDPADQTLIVGRERENFHRELMAKRVNWLRPMDQLRGLRCKARIRPQGPEAACLVTSFENGEVHVHFEEPQLGPSPGQAVVFYDGDEVLGGAFIDRIMSEM